MTPHPAGGYLVSFGTGSYLSRDDLGTTTTLSLYGIRDSGTALLHKASVRALVD